MIAAVKLGNIKMIRICITKFRGGLISHTIDRNSLIKNTMQTYFGKPLLWSLGKNNDKTSIINHISVNGIKKRKSSCYCQCFQ